MDEQAKHPNYRSIDSNINRDLTDNLVPRFKYDMRRGRLVMPLPGYAVWHLSTEPGSKIIAQGSADEAGKANTDPGSLQTGSLSADTSIRIGDSIYLDGINGYISVGRDPLKSGGAFIISDNSLTGWDANNLTFGWFVNPETWGSRSFDRGDFIVGTLTIDKTGGTITGGQGIWWDNTTNQLYIGGDIEIMGDIQSANYVPGTSGYKLTYATGDAEFQDIVARGVITVLNGSTIYDADGNIIGSTLVASGGYRAYNALNAYNQYKEWLNSRTLNVRDTSIMTYPCIIMDNYGIYGLQGPDLGGPDADNPVLTFKLESSTGNLFLRGTVFASSGYIGYDPAQPLRGAWEIYNKAIRNITDLGGIVPGYPSAKTKVQMLAGNPGAIQAVYSRDGQFGLDSYTDLVQITQGGYNEFPSPDQQPIPRLDVIYQGIVRASLRKDGLYFYNSSGSLINKISGSSSYTSMDSDDLRIGTNGAEEIRIWKSGTTAGIRVNRGLAYNCADGAGGYFQMYVDNSSDPSFGYQDMLHLSTSNYLKISNFAGNAIARFNGATDSYKLMVNGGLKLQPSSQPTVGQAGVMYYNVTDNKPYYYNGSAWVDFGGSGGGITTGSNIGTTGWGFYYNVSGTTMNFRRLTSNTSSGIELSEGTIFPEMYISVNHRTGAGFRHIPTSGNLYEMLINNGSGSATWAPLQVNYPLDIARTTSYITISHLSGNGANHIPSGGSSGQFLRWNAAGTAVWASPPGGISGAFNISYGSAVGVYYGLSGNDLMFLPLNPLNSIYIWGYSNRIDIGHYTSAGHKHIPSGGWGGAALVYDAFAGSGSAGWGSPSYASGCGTADFAWNAYKIDITSAYADYRVSAGYWHTFYVGGTARVYISGTGLQIVGNFSASGTKSFIVPHPEDNTKSIRYNAQESAEVVVRARGRVQLENGRATCSLPDTWKHVSEKNTTMVIATPCGKCNGVYVENDDDTLTFVELLDGISNVFVNWEATATRKEYKDYAVIIDNPDKEAGYVIKTFAAGAFLI
jgi:hypothetical protein